MKKQLALAVAVSLLALPLMAESDKKEAERLENCGTVIKEIMDIPDDIPQDLIDKAECVIVYPSVLKGAFIVGGSYGRGAMTCRTGEHYTGPWGAPSMMALEGAPLRQEDRREARGPTLDGSSWRQAAGRGQNVHGLPRDHHERTAIRAVQGRSSTRAAAYDG